MIRHPKILPACFRNAGDQTLRSHLAELDTADAEQPRMTVYRSNKQIYVQFIDDLAGVTMAAASSLDKEAVSYTHLSAP